MNLELRQSDRNFTQWVRATFFDWLLGFILVIVLALALEMLGGSAQFMVGVGMGADVGYMQGRVLRRTFDETKHWMWASVIGMGLPFVMWDLSAGVGIEFLFSILSCVIAGSLFVGSLQWRILRSLSEKAIWWVPACIVSWALAAAALRISEVVPGPLSAFIFFALFLLAASLWEL